MQYEEYYVRMLKHMIQIKLINAMKRYEACAL